MGSSQLLVRRRAVAGTHLQLRDVLPHLVQRAGSAESAVHSRRIECHGPRAQRTQLKAAEAVTPVDC